MSNRSLQWKNLIGQNRVKTAVGKIFEADSFGHAYLLAGSDGVGKFQAALELSLAILCEHPDQAPCYQCKQCKQILSYSHPDFHCVFPVSLEKEHKKSGESSKLTEEGWKFVSDETLKKIQNPYSNQPKGTSSLPIEWIRELNESIKRGTTEAPKNIAILCDVDTLQAGAANAMLKTLEEPPPDTLILLLTSKLYAVLPTIRSRCQVIPFGILSADDIKSNLIKNGFIDSNSSSLSHIIHNASGSYGAALQLLDESLDKYAKGAERIWEFVAQGSDRDWRDAIRLIEELNNDIFDGGKSPGEAVKVVTALLHIIRSAFFSGISGAPNYITEINSIGYSMSNISIQQAGGITDSCENAISALKSYGNPLLVLITFVMETVDIIDGGQY